MPSVKCPSCGEKGPIARHLIGMRIKCKKCGTSFLVSEPAPKVAVVVAQTAATPDASGHTIEVAGLDDSSWSATAVVPVEHHPDHPHEPHHDETSSSFTASHPEEHGLVAACKLYKLLTQKDKYFAGKFELSRLEDALNHYAHEGWSVRSMVTPLVTGFSGGPREEIVVLLERDK